MWRGTWSILAACERFQLAARAPGGWRPSPRRPGSRRPQAGRPGAAPRGGGLGGEVLGAEKVRVPQRDRALEHVRELPDVALPSRRPALQAPSGPMAMSSPGRCAAGSAEPAAGRPAGPLAQRRQAHGDDRQPVEEVLAEAARPRPRRRGRGWSRRRRGRRPCASRVAADPLERRVPAARAGASPARRAGSRRSRRGRGCRRRPARSGPRCRRRRR